MKYQTVQIRRSGKQFFAEKSKIHCIVGVMFVKKKEMHKIHGNTTQWALCQNNPIPTVQKHMKRFLDK